MELIKDYVLNIHYHLGKANVVVNALSKRYTYRAPTDLTEQRLLLKEMRRFELEVGSPSSEMSLANMHIQPNLLERIKITQMQDPKLQEICARLQQGVPSHFRVHEDGTVRFGNRVYIPYEGYS